MSGLRLSDNIEVRVFHSQLADEVRAVHGARCPCCLKVMVKPRRQSIVNKRRRDKITVAHDKPVGMGGDPTVWVFACLGCNGDQAARPFAAWASQLARSGDARAAAVAALAHFIATFLERTRHGKPAGPVSTTAVVDAVAGR